MRVGIGYDVHAFADGRSLVLGGVTIPHEQGLAGHSDADVLLHALCDALLGAAGMGDIGRHFPDTDPAFKDIDSLVLLERTMDLVRSRGLAVANIDATILAEAPRMWPHIPAMRENISRVLGVPPDDVNIKATTSEGMGFIGRREGIAAMCVALLD
ncbi:MAG: 2-C-methyl-D-erythritol 2,4-cyclodiphosphate synthase [Desulfobacteraceae bacterium]|jgi:2-C-methyl-D-erythritol 2,4-cyclodiphosphate synthase|nr:MAG: 2-C-methyl-D-erythritol 2,4-cyclodiphosphate synthase [Desulfobacteraceae bacterium]